jgi:hypothetical protein
MKKSRMLVPFKAARAFTWRNSASGISSVVFMFKEYGNIYGSSRRTPTAQLWPPKAWPAGDSTKLEGHTPLCPWQGVVLAGLMLKTWVAALLTAIWLAGGAAV